MSSRIPIPATERFYSKVNKDGPYPDPEKYPSLEGRCWEWMNPLMWNGYGQFFVSGRKCSVAHRWSWSSVNGEIPKGMIVCHSCDNRKCVNPDHLFLGTVGDNNKDMLSKGRYARGEKMGSAKLNSMQVRVMRRMRGFGIPYAYMGRIFGVSHGKARKAVLGINWSHV